jgi:hypothetical protein
MLAGTLARFDPALDSSFDGWFSTGGDRLPAVEVSHTQTRVNGGAPVQRGKVAGRVETQRQEIMVAAGADGTPEALFAEREQHRQMRLAEWVADPQETGLLAVSTTGGSGQAAFPFNIFGHSEVAGDLPRRLTVNIESMVETWRETGDRPVDDVWMATDDQVPDDDGDGAEETEAGSTTITYHDAADTTATPSIGVGFARTWNGAVIRGVVYASGYLALYNVEDAATFVGFVADDVLPHTRMDEQEVLTPDGA